MVSAPGIYYKIWIAFILGLAGGAVQVGLTKALNKAKEDDPLQVFQTHGIPAVLSLVLIVLFHSDTGIFFTNYNELITQMKMQQII